VQALNEVCNAFDPAKSTRMGVSMDKISKLYDKLKELIPRPL